MRLLLASVLTIILFSLFYYSYKLTNDLFSPLCVFSFFQWLRYVPGIGWLNKDSLVNFDDGFLYLLFIYEFFAIICTFLGYAVYKQYFSSKKMYEIRYRFICKKNVAYLAFVLGFIAGLYYLHLWGGAEYVINRLRVENIGVGKGYLMSLMSYMIVGMVICLCKDKKVTFKLIVMFLIYAWFYVIFTKRAPIMECLMILVMAYNYGIKKFKASDFINIKTVLLLSLCAIYISVMPVIRNNGGLGSVENFHELVNILSEATESFFYQFSYSTRDGFVYSNFNLDNYWYGSNVLNLIYAPLPYTFFPWKPPIDDGVYLLNFMHGYYVQPPSNEFPILSSMPFSTQSVMFANFGIIGLMIGCFFMGGIYSYFYKIMVCVGRDPFMIIIYQLIVYKLALSSLNIVQTIVPFVLCLIFAKVLCGWALYTHGKAEKKNEHSL